MYLIENGEAIVLEIGPSEAEAISKSSSLWRRRLKVREEPLRLTKNADGNHELEARGVAGFVRVGNTTLEIAPKFLNQETAGPYWRSAMWRFLAYGRGIEALSQSSGGFGVEDGIADILADIFLSSLKGASIRGYPMGYRSRRFNSSFVTGRIDPMKYSKLLPVTGKIGVIANQLTSDMPTSRLLKWAGQELARTVESPGRRKQLKLWATELPSVSTIPPRLEQIPSLSHQYPHLIHAVEIGKLLLEDRDLSFSQEDINLPGFLWDSEDLFERAMRRLMSEAARPLGLAASKRTQVLAKTYSIGEEASTYSTPDIDVRRGECSVFIADAKYKNLGKNPSNADFYQVLAAGRIRATPKVALLYPAAGLGLTDKTYTPMGDGNPVTILATTIGLESFSSRLKVRQLRDEITKWLADAISIPTP